MDKTENYTHDCINLTMLCHAEWQETAHTNFVSLGLVVLDELRLPSGAILCDHIGGSGAYGTLGARIVTESTRAHEIGCFILAGQDFPPHVAALLKSWNISLEVDVDNDKLSTRGLLEYHEETFNYKTFRYLTPPLQPMPRHLPRFLLASESFHILSAPENVPPCMNDLLQLRQQHKVGQRPLIVWEPLPAKCLKEHLEMHMQACGSVDIFSPNHLELLSLFDEATEVFTRELIEECAARLLKPQPLSAVKAIVVRAAEHGCFLVDGATKKWLPPFYSHNDRVIDVTGAGNTFLGALTTVFQRTRDLTESAIQATVAASFALEQISLPERTVSQESGEVWNGVKVSQRLEEYRARLCHTENDLV
ncbi:Ribokinase-like protein [Biscogniauxia mediterranea]|nr:Ribokinase-like protein [Biscogniauxia mediterranea]